MADMADVRSILTGYATEGLWKTRMLHKDAIDMRASGPPIGIRHDILLEHANATIHAAELIRELPDDSMVSWQETLVCRLDDMVRASSFESGGREALIAIAVECMAAILCLDERSRFQNRYKPPEEF